MKKFTAVLFAFALAGLSSGASAEVIAAKQMKLSGGVVAEILVTDEVSKSCNKYFEGTRFAAMIIRDAATARIQYRYPGCYAMREKGELSLSFWNDDLVQWVSYTSLTSGYERTAYFKGWPGAPKGYEGYDGKYPQEADDPADAVIEKTNEKAR